MRNSLAVLVAMVLSFADLGAQTVQQIVNNAKAAAVRRAASVNNYTVVQDMNGLESTIYYEKQMVDGFPVFTSRRADLNLPGARGRGGRGSGEDEAMRKASSVMATKEFVERAKLQGTETVDGKRTYKILVENLGTLEAFRGMAANSNVQVTPKTMTMNIDATEYVPIRLILTMSVAMGGGSAQDMSMTSTMTDYRNVQGVLHPFRVTMSRSGGPDMSGANAAMQAQLDQMKAALANLPPEQRELAEDALASRMGGAGAMGELVTVTKSLRVNTGPPGGQR
jgi:hypothetical protein